MKTIILTLSLSFLSFLSYAQFHPSQVPDSCCYIAEDIRAAIYKENDSMINVRVVKIPGELVKIRVKENNKVLYQKRLKKWAIADLKYDISQFPNGEYTFEIIKDRKVVYSIVLEKGLVDNVLALGK